MSFQTCKCVSCILMLIVVVIMLIIIINDWQISQVRAAARKISDAYKKQPDVFVAFHLNKSLSFPFTMICSDKHNTKMEGTMGDVVLGFGFGSWQILVRRQSQTCGHLLRPTFKRLTPLSWGTRLILRLILIYIATWAWRRQLGNFCSTKESKDSVLTKLSDLM